MHAISISLSVKKFPIFLNFIAYKDDTYIKSYQWINVNVRKIFFFIQTYSSHFITNQLLNRKNSKIKTIETRKE